MEGLPLQSVGQLEQLFICSGSLVEYLDFSHSFNKYSLKTRTILSDGYTLGRKTKTGSLGSSDLEWWEEKIITKITEKSILIKGTIKLNVSKQERVYMLRKSTPLK